MRPLPGSNGDDNNFCYKRLMPLASFSDLCILLRRVNLAGKSMIPEGSNVYS